MNMELEKRDQMFGKLHQLAALEYSELKEQYSADNINFLYSLVSEFWLTRAASKDLTPEEFAELIMTLREEEKEWSRKLGQMLIAVEDLSEDGNTDKIEEYFDYFINKCPCVSLVSLAKIEKNNYLD